MSSLYIFIRHVHPHAQPVFFEVRFELENFQNCRS